jgi:hypothetical protein
MHDFHYNILKPKYGDNIPLLMTDTDKFVYEIKKNAENKKVIGKFKDESPDEVIESF